MTKKEMEKVAKELYFDYLDVERNNDYIEVLENLELATIEENRKSVVYIVGDFLDYLEENDGIDLSELRDNDDFANACFKAMTVYSLYYIHEKILKGLDDINHIKMTNEEEKEEREYFNDLMIRYNDVKEYYKEVIA